MGSKALPLPYLLLIAFLLGLALFGWLHIVELRAEEPRRAIVSIEMWLSGNYLVPQISGWPYYNKPPVFNWVMAGFFQLFGSTSEWVVRLPSLISWVVLGLFHGWLIGKWIDRETGILAGLFLITGADLLFFGTIVAGEIDLFYALVIYLQIISLYYFHQKKQWVWMMVWSYFFCAVGALTKGLPSPAFQAFTLLAMGIWYQRWVYVISWQHAIGIILFFGLTGGYFYLYEMEGQNAIAFILRQFDEATKGTELHYGWQNTVIQTLTFPFQFVRLLFPWGLLAVFFFIPNIRQKIKAHPFLSFSVLFILSNVWLYWLSGRFRARYVYMFLPFMTALLAYAYVHWRELLPKSNHIIHYTLGGLITLLPVAMVVPIFLPQTNWIPWLSFKMGIVLIPTVFIVITYWRKETYRIYLVILAIILTRIAFNTTYLPALQADQKSMYYKNTIAKLVDDLNGERLYQTGRPYQLTNLAKFGPVDMGEQKVFSAPLLSYKIPYYYHYHSGQLLLFEPELEQGKLYLSNSPAYYQKQDSFFFEFFDRWNQMEIKV